MRAQAAQLYVPGTLTVKCTGNVEGKESFAATPYKPLVGEMFKACRGCARARRSVVAGGPERVQDTDVTALTGVIHYHIPACAPPDSSHPSSCGLLHHACIRPARSFHLP